MNTKVLSFRIPEDSYEAFDSKCSEAGSNPSDVLKKLVENYCHPQPKKEKANEPVNDVAVSHDALEARVKALEKTTGDMQTMMNRIIEGLRNEWEAPPKAEPVANAARKSESSIFSFLWKE